jgi:hypothetical protein
MKLKLAIGILGIAAMSASCRKERSCDCKTKETEVRTGFGEKTTVFNTTEKVTKAKQKKNSFKYESACFSETYSYPSSGGNGPSAWSSVTTVETTCTLD